MAVEGRQTTMTVGLGGEQLLLRRFRCLESMGGSFELEVDIIAPLGEIDLMPHLGEPIAVHVDEDGEHARHFHGIVVGGDFLHERGGRHEYRLTARPFTHFLSRNVDMAIFQNKSVPDIIKQILQNAGISDYDFLLKNSYPTRDYCVQYRESDLTFITRLMEEEGIYYFWKHEEARHVMVLCDAPSAHVPGEPASLTFNPHAAVGHWSQSLLRGASTRFLQSFGEQVTTGAEALVTLRAFDFKKPDLAVEGSRTEALGHAGREREVYRYPDVFLDKARGTGLSTVRLETLRRDRQAYEGETPALGLACGTTLTVAAHVVPRLDASYLITHTEHLVHNEALRSAGGDFHVTDGEPASHVVFHAIPAATPYRLLEVTPKPVVHGLETAIVTGPDGEEIFTDEYGRVKVRFHWDRSGSASESSTCWIRVAQFGGLGNVILPRVGQEVMVNFLHGNPDEPIIMGWVFNQSQMPVYELPKNRSRHVFRGRSYPGGKSTSHPGAATLDSGSPGANEIRLEDKAGSEEVFVHAEKDLNTRIRNDETHHVARNQVEKVFWSRDDYVGHDETTVIKNNQTLTVEEGNQTEKIKKGNREVTIETGNDTLTVKTGNLTTDVATGNISIKADLGKIEIEAMQSITLKVGGSSIVIDQVGVTIQGTVKVETKGVMVQSTADAISTLKGALVMIN